MSIVRATPDDAGRRIDNFVLGRLKGVPRSRVYRMIRGGEVRINGRRAKPATRIESGDEIRLPPVAAKSAPLPQGNAVALDIERRIVFEDSDVLVVDKPAGLAVHGGSGIRHGVIEQLRLSRGQRGYLELVHRLDRDTSGCLLVAKKRSALRGLHEQFRRGDIVKQYAALLHGRWGGGDRTVDAPLLTSHRRGGERFVRVDPEGKAARTRFILARQFDRSCLVRVILETGRTHQIRVHAAHIGHPIAGDTRYGVESDPIMTRFGLRRLFLHAEALAFEARGGERLQRVECPIDPVLETCLERVAAATAR